jgi:hypothetical protein
VTAQLSLPEAEAWAIGVWTEGRTVYLSRDGVTETWSTYEAALAVANNVEREAPGSLYTCERIR